MDLLTYIYVQRRIDPSLRISASDMEYIKTVVSGERIFTKHLEENRELHNCRVEDGTHGSSRITARLRVVGRKSAVDGAVINLRICVSFHTLRMVLDNLRDFFVKFSFSGLLLGPAQHCSQLPRSPSRGHRGSAIPARGARHPSSLKRLLVLLMASILYYECPSN